MKAGLSGLVSSREPRRDEFFLGAIPIDVFHAGQGLEAVAEISETTGHLAGQIKNH